MPGEQSGNQRTSNRLIGLVGGRGVHEWWAMETPADVPYDVLTIAIIVTAGIATAIAIIWCSHLFDRWWQRRWSRHA